MEIRYSNHPTDAKKYDTNELRSHFLIEKVFEPGKIKLVYSHIDRIIAGGISPSNEKIRLEPGKELGGVQSFFERREGGVINVGAPGKIILDGETHELRNKDALYIGLGVKEAIFEANAPANPPKFYFNSCPAHHSYPSKRITLEDAKKVALGDIKTSNK